MAKTAKKLAGMLLSAVLLCAGNLCINASKTQGQIPYISVTVTFLIEVLKLVVVSIAILVLRVPPPTNFTFKESLYYAVPSLLYMIDNNLTYVILRYIDPATLAVLWNLKIITTAVLFRFVLKRRLSEIRIIAIILLLLGVVTSQSDHIKKEHGHDEKKSPMDMGDKLVSEKSNADFIFAMILVLVMVTISSCASVFTEWTFKRKTSCSFLYQNVLLYIYGILFNGIGVLVQSDELSERGFFDGYNSWTVAVIFVNCVGGISVGFILRFLDNIACVYAHAVAMMLTMLFSMVFFKFTPSLEFICGLSVLLISMYLYHHKIETGSAGTGRGTRHPGSASSDTESASSCHSPRPKEPSGDGIITASSAIVSLSAAGLHVKKKPHYEKVPTGLHDIELGSASSPSLDDDNE
ncbi:hypothetical protein Poli38472_004528 [Pythium oligandrum]|uniref:UDP-galactose transporter n=1 Tax=Pythium oligandrum TaxID=41045 RepID=A0A8K1FFZ3_PYTOL|nr:hypothetical protein Poli38472_004528 [Pythium oligandrum]|eukprot:TMW59459.1 hypothetical protein Poli38472_004528 [Pythium oligandrum]